MILLEIQQCFTLLKNQSKTFWVFQKELWNLLYQYKMSQYDTLNVKLSLSQLNKLNTGIKKWYSSNLNLSSNTVGNSNGETDSPHALLLTDTQVSAISKVYSFISIKWVNITL